MISASPAPFLSSAAPPDLLQAALEISLTGFVLFRPLYRAAAPLTITDLAYEHLNPAAQRMLRLPERPAESFLTLYPNAMDTGIFAFYRDTFLAGEAGRYDVNYQADGLDNYFQLTARRAGDLLVVSFSDTAEQSRTPVEEALRESQAREQAARAEAEVQRQRFYDVLMQLPAHVALHEGPDQTFTLVNPDYRRIANNRDLVGQPIREAWPELVSHGILDVLDGVYQTGEPYIAAEVPVQADFTRTGQLEEVYYNFFFLPLRDAQGQITGVLNFSYDVTAFVRARQQVEQLNQELEARVQARTRQLSEQQQLLRQILSNVPAYIATLSGPEHRYTFFNELYHTLSADRTALGLTVAEVYPEVVSQGFIGLLDQVYATGEPFVGTATPALLLSPVTGQPEQRYVDFLYQPLFDEEHRVQGILAFILDVTDKVLARQQSEQSQQQVYDLNEELAAINEELRATNEELSDSNHRLTRTNVDLDNFIYTASHDLKAPISNIEGLLFLLREDLPADVAQAPHIAPTLTRMLGAVERFKRTIEHLTEVTKLQKEHTRATVSVDLAAVVEDVLLDMAPLLREANAQLRVEVSDFPLVRFSEKNLRSVVYNLLSNALKYRHPDRRPHIDVQAHVRPGYTVLEVHDNGLGLDEAQLPRLFNLFQRFHSHVEGTGIGLYMVKRMVENARGRIEVNSRPQGGTTFYIYLPNTAPTRA